MAWKLIFCSGCHYLTPCDGVENPTVDPAMRMTIIIEFDGNKGHLASATYNPQKLLVFWTRLE